MPDKKIIILGAGPAGLACAYGLSQKNKACLMIEKDTAVGGLAKTLEFPEGQELFRTDIGPHRFFSKNKELYELISGLLGPDWIMVNRQTRQYIRGKFYDYPIRALQAFKNIGPLESLLIFFSYLKGVTVYQIFKKPLNTFQDYIVANFGLRLGQFNMLNYSEKIWGLPCLQIHPDWAQQRIKGLNFISALKEALFKNNRGQVKTLVDTFYYPRYGTGQIYQAMADKIRQTGSEIFTSSLPTAIYHQNNLITGLEINHDNVMEKIIPENLVSSIPIDEFIKLLKPTAPSEVITAINNLKWRAQIYLFITLNKKTISTDNWIYLPELKIPFARIAEMKNFSPAMAPSDKTSLFIEFFVNSNDQLWQNSAEEIFQLALKHLEEIELIKKEEVRHYYVFKKDKVYPVYDLAYPENLKIIKNYLNSFSNLIYLGRPGRFQYNNQDHSLEMGLLASQSLLEDKKYDLDYIGQESEYFEKGSLTSENA